MTSREEQPITAFKGKRGTLGIWGLSTDGRFIYFTWEEARGDIWIADLMQPPGK